MSNMSLESTTSPPMLGPGEVMKTSGKFPKPTRIPGKNYCKDEVVIRNADSGKGIKNYPIQNAYKKNIKYVKLIV